MGREHELEKMNRTALQIARKVATRTGTLMAGNICNTTIYNPNDAQAVQKVKDIFKVQCDSVINFRYVLH